MKLAGIAGRGNEIVGPGLPSNHEQWRAQRTNCRWEMWRIIEDTPVGNTSTNMFPRKALAMHARNGHRACCWPAWDEMESWSRELTVADGKIIDACFSARWNNGQYCAQGSGGGAGAYRKWLNFLGYVLKLSSSRREHMMGKEAPLCGGARRK